MLLLCFTLILTPMLSKFKKGCMYKYIRKHLEIFQEMTKFIVRPSVIIPTYLDASFSSSLGLNLKNRRPHVEYDNFLHGTVSCDIYFYRNNRFTQPSKISKAIRVRTPVLLIDKQLFSTILQIFIFLSKLIYKNYITKLYN